MKQLKESSSYRDNRVISWEQRRFDSLYKDPPASETPQYSVADLFNVLLYGEWAEVRPGTRLWSAENLPSLKEEFFFSAGGGAISPLPEIPGRSDYVASKDGYLVTKTVGRDFISTDQYKFFVWPDGTSDIITEVVNSSTFRARRDTIHTASTADDPAKIRGRINEVKWHDETRRLFFHIDTRVFWTDWQMIEFTEIKNVSDTLPTDQKSTLDEEEGFVHLFTDAGIFKIDGDEMYQINTESPDNHASGLTKTTARNLGRRYLYTFSRLEGNIHNDRGDGSRIMKETGSNIVRTSNDFNDFQEIYHVTEPNALGNGDLLSYIVSAADMTSRIDEWKLILDGSFRASFLEDSPVAYVRNVVCDFSTIRDWEDIAEVITKALQATFPELPDVECKFLDQRFYFFCGNGDRNQTPSIGNAAGVGTDISGAAYLNTLGEGPVDITSAHIIGNKNEPLKIEGKQWTHISMYGNKTVEVKNRENFDDEAGKEGKNPDYYVWLDDIPVAKAFTGAVSEIGVSGFSYANFVATKGTFSPLDVGSYLRFEDGRELQIIRYMSPTEVGFTFSTEVPISLADFPLIPTQTAVMSGGRIMTLSQIGNTVTRESGSAFTAADVGKPIFWADGDYSWIKEFVDADTVTAWESVVHDSQGATMDPVGRSYNDTHDNEDVQARAKSIPLRNRFFTALPSGRLGTVAGGFMLVSQKNGELINYSQMPSGLEYLVGHHYVEFQKHPVKDSIQSIQEFPDKVIIYCSNNTYRIQTNVTSFVETPEVGESIATISGIGLLADIGIKDQGSIRRIDGGAHIVTTSEPGIRRMDGYNYSENLAIDQNGIGFNLKELQKLQSIVTTGYTDIFGYIIWGSDEDLTNNQVLDLNKCYKLGIKSQHSRGWGELGGDSWVFPEPNIGTFKVYNDKDQAFDIIMDANTGLPYMLSTREGPSDSGIFKVWKDKIGINYDTGVEIDWRMKLKEHRGSREDYLIRHLTSHLGLRPQDESNQGADGYTAGGYRDAQEINVSIYKNGEVDSTATTKDIPYKADITVDRQVEDNRVQIEISGTASELKIVRVATDYERKIQRGGPSQRLMTEHNYQNEMGETLHWICDADLIDRGTGGQPTGEIFGFTTGPGADAMVFATASELTYGELSLTGNFTIMFGLSNIVGDTEIIKIGDATVRVEVSGSVYSIEFFDGVNTYSQDLEWDGEGFIYLKVSREADNLIFSEDGGQLISLALGSIETVSGTIEYRENNPKTLFDPRVYSSRISEAAFEYYHRNVTTEEGVAVLCP